MMTQPPEVRLLDKFPDGISALSYLPKSASSHNNGKSLLASTSWDGAVRVHDTWSDRSSDSPLLLAHNMESGPLLSLGVMGGSSPAEAATIVTGGLDGSIKSFDISTSTVQSIGSHGVGSDSIVSGDTNTNIGNACSCLCAMGDADHPSKVVASASWNRQLCIWDLRQENNKKASSQLLLPGKAFSMDVDVSRNRIIVATSGRRTCVYDLRMMKEENTCTLEAVLERESSLKFQTRCVRFFPDGHGFCLGSIEGRVGVEFLDDLADERMLSVTEKPKKYAFKCHRDSNSGLVYPVNAIDFHPIQRQTFATGGCDGTVVLWDGQNKKKLTALPAFPTSISALCFSPDGTELAIASSYTHEEGDREQHPQDELYVRQILGSEAMPKAGK